MQVAAASSSSSPSQGTTDQHLTRSQSVKNNDRVKMAEINEEPGENSELVNELERLKKDKLTAFYEIERYKKLVTIFVIIFKLNVLKM